MARNGLIAMVDGPYKGKKHDSSMLADFNLFAKLSHHSYTPHEEPLCSYGDPGCPLSMHLQGPF